MTRYAVDADDVLASVTAVAAMLEGPASSDDPSGWDGAAGILEWSCRHTAAHVADCLIWYGANLARRSIEDVEAPEMAVDAAPNVLVDTIRSGGALLAAAVLASNPDDRGYHPFGIADPSGFAAMGCDEVLVHGADIAAGFGLAFDPPGEVCDRVVRRLYPWAPTDVDPWAALLWANGRAPLGDAPPESRWLWHCAPLDEWDGTIRRY